jgi:hypothetical protein
VKRHVDAPCLRAWLKKDIPMLIGLTKDTYVALMKGQEKLSKR